MTQHDERELAVWGTGAKYQELKRWGEVAISGLIDNNPDTHGTELGGVMVHGPQWLAEQGPERYRVIVASTHYLSIAEQLEAMGFRRDRDYCYVNRFMEFGWAPHDPEIEAYLASHVCREPFSSFIFHETGDIYTCCQAYLDLPIGNIFTQEWDEIWNSSRAQGIRRSVLEGTYSGCSRKCPFIVSRRLTPKTTSVLSPRMESGPEKIGLGCDETCNLSCPSCRGGLIVRPESHQQRVSAALHGKIRPLLPQVRSLELLGSGEVFASPSVSGFLRTLDRAEAPNLDLTLISNGQLFTPERWQEYSNIHGMVQVLSISMDAATPATFEKLRRGGRWDRMIRNLRFLAGLRAQGEIGHLILRFVVQAENFREMKGFVELGMELKADAVVFNRIVNWGSMTDQELQAADVVHPGHPDHPALCEVLRDPVFQSRMLHIDFDNMADLVKGLAGIS